MVSSDDGLDRKSWKWKRGCHRALLATLGAWMILTFFSTQHQCEDGKYDGWIVLKRHSISHEPLNLLGRISKAIHTPDDLQVQSDNRIVASSAQHNRMVEEIARVPKEGITCDLSHFRTDICYLSGDVRVNCGNNGSVAMLNSAHGTSDRIIAKIKPYTRKWEGSCMKTIGEVAVKTVGYAADHKIDVACSVNHSVPAVIFSTGGYTGNLYHEFNDGLIPLFITSEKFKGEVVFLILELHDWWMMKYGSIIKRLSNYPVLDFDGSRGQIHCFPQVTVGLKIHDELAINPVEMEGRKTMRDFQQLLKDSLNSGTGQPVNGMLPVTQRKPRLVLLSRNGSRVILNQDEVIKLAKRIGFEVVILAPHSHTELSKVHELLHSAEVLVGVHGAALTHLLFMRPGSIFIQIIPLGTDWAAKTYYGEPAVKAGLRYIEYKIVPQESSLVQKFGRNHIVVTHPEKITSKGWWEMKKIYLQSQDVIISLPRFQPILQQAFKQATGKQESTLN